jgi:uncharacterized protein
VLLPFFIILFDNNDMSIQIRSHRLSYLLDDKEVAYINFPMAKEGVVTISHTFVSDTLRGQGIAKTMMDALVVYLRENHLKALPACSYAQAYFQKYPEYGDLVYIDKE